MNIQTYRACGLAALVLLLSPLGVSAQKAAQGPFRSVEIQVKDLSTDQIIATVRPGGTVTLQEGQKVRLIMTALHTGQARGPYYPETEFTETEPGRGRVRVTRTSVENANATVEIVNPNNSNRNWTETLRYKIVEDIALPNGQREGSVTIRVEPASASFPIQIGSASARSARELTNLLYRGILLRDLDETGASPYIARIEDGGYPALIEVAREIARSEESRARVYERTGATNPQRLDALYLNLLNLSGTQIDRSQWDENLSLMSQGRLEEVVANLVRSDRFQDLYGLSLERTALRRFRQ